MSQSFLITLTAPSASGKSFLLNYIRDVAKLPCLISTTTRAQRAGEVEGVDYFFISKEQSEVMQENGEFAELAIFGGHRYGVTKAEFMNKLNSPEGLAFLIVEPNGIDHYVAPALEVGAKHLKFFIDIPLDVRLERLKARTTADILNLIGQFVKTQNISDPRVNKIDIQTGVNKIITAYTNRLTSVLGDELYWVNACKWDGILDGSISPEENLRTIISVVEQAKNNFT